MWLRCQRALVRTTVILASCLVLTPAPPSRAVAPIDSTWSREETASIRE